MLFRSILRENVVNIMGTGMVIDLEHLSNEKKKLTDAGVKITPKNLKISDRAIICMPYHKQLDGFFVCQRYYGKAWTGYDAAGSVSDVNREDPMVYITKTGTVYHLDRNCTYLNPRVEAVSVDGVEHRRNASGSRYGSCGSCSSSATGREVYITYYGNHYHENLNCPGLKRTIYTVPLSEADARGRCSKCG